METTKALTPSAAQSLSVLQLVTQVFEALQKELNGRNIPLPQKVTAEIGNDSDGHRIRIGYIGYESFTLINVEGRQGIIAFGLPCGHYPADPYGCDIFACITTLPEDEEELIDKAEDLLRGNYYFGHSLIVGMATGNISFAEGGKFAKMISGRFERSDLSTYIAQNLEVDRSCIATSTLSHPVRRAMEYKPEFVPVLTSIFKEVLMAQ